MNDAYKAHLTRQGFEIQEKIGSGLSGDTYKGIQNSLNRPVAIKFFDSQFSKHNSDLRKRFVRESQLLAELQHPSIPYVITKGFVNDKDEETPYMVMQYISGITLDNYFKLHGHIDLNSALHVAFQLLDALNFTHARKIVHRDIKPSNIMVLPSGHCYLIDFSIGFKSDTEPGTTRATRTGDHLGSVQYMSPEQATNMKDVDGRSDIYSLTKVLCEMLSGKPDINALKNNGVQYSSAFLAILEKSGAYSPEERYINANDFLRELKHVTSSSSQFLTSPSKAVCNSTVCPEANWSPRGYYRGPRFIEESIDTFCTSCGNKLLYKCPGCGNSIEKTAFCGGCGTKQFSIPECEQCGSFLMKEDMNKNTKDVGCSKCRSNKPRTPLSIPTDSYDDDIPF